jgi:TrmH family RNA methyltransferase
MAGDNLYTHQSKNGIYILGKESTGLSEPVRELLSGTLNIPGQGEAESLNVSIAGALLMSELFRSKA